MTVRPNGSWMGYVITALTAILLTAGGHFLVYTGNAATKTDVEAAVADGPWVRDKALFEHRVGTNERAIRVVQDSLQAMNRKLDVLLARTHP